MSITKTLGGDRLGSGNKQKVEMHGYDRSSFNLSKLWRSTMSAGTLVPFLQEIALPGTTFDIDLEAEANTHPTVGPLFGSYKMQLDVFRIPMRLYNAIMHNDTINIGRDMSKVKFPLIELLATKEDYEQVQDIDNSQINPSCLLAYLGIRGIGLIESGSIGATQTRQFNAMGILGYWDTYKNYYAAKFEEIGAVIHTPSVAITQVVTAVAKVVGPTETLIVLFPTIGNVVVSSGQQLRVVISSGTFNPSQIIFSTNLGDYTAEELGQTWVFNGSAWDATYNEQYAEHITIFNYRLQSSSDIVQRPPEVVTFPLENIDLMKKQVLALWDEANPLIINDADLAPYKYLYQYTAGIPNSLSSQEGLALKTYQSDLFNNWLKTENIDALATATAIDTTGGSFLIDTFIFNKKMYDLLMRINVAGGSSDDWLEAVYAHEQHSQPEKPIYMGGLIKELVFQEVVSNSESAEGAPLGSLAGKGTLSNKHKGGKVVIRCDEPSLILGLCSLTPRVDYSQGNKWFTQLKTWDDLHKPQYDQIGFQESITEQRAWWDTTYVGSAWVTKSAGKVPAWLNYMTDVNECYGNFAIPNNEMYMTLNRRFEFNFATYNIADLTTYIDPSKYNFIFAQTSIDAQNFWIQIGMQITARRKQSSKVMPNI